MSRLNTFVPPRPNPAVMTAMTYINRLLIVGGLPGLKHLRPRPLTRITAVNFSAADQATLRALVSAEDTAVFITPNHPEFFTDWMLDKYLLSLVAPHAASWATHTIVNGMGRIAQWFWLANNLIAQIPRVAETAKFHSIKVAARGDGVLLHPEGSVGWHSNYIGPVFPGAVDMAFRVQELHPEVLSSYVAPVVWKLVFTTDVTDGLLAEYRFICRQLQIITQADLGPAQAVYHLYEELLARDESVVQILSNRNDSVWERLPEYLKAASAELAELVFSTEDGAALQRAARKWQQSNQNADRAKARKVQLLLSSIERWEKFRVIARRSDQVTQEELAEHQKRLRAELCVSGIRNKLNKYVPIAVGPRHAFVRVLEPLLMPELPVSQTREERTTIVDEMTLALRARLQLGIDNLNAELNGCFITYLNPFL